MPIDRRIRYFSTLSATALKELSSRAGKKSWQVGGAHRYTAREGMLAGRKGGRVRAAKYRELRELRALLRAIDREEE